MRTRVLADEERLALVMEATQEGFFEIDLLTSKTKISARSQEILGYNDPEITSTYEKLLALTHPEDLPSAQSATADAIAGKTAHVVTPMRLRHFDGHYVPVLARAAVGRTPDGKPVRLVGTILDLTIRERIARELRVAERRYHDIVEQSPQGIYQTTPGGRLLTVNLACARMLGFGTPEELIKIATADQFYVDSERRAQFMEEVAAHDTVVGFEARFRRKDGRIIWTSNTARAVRSEGGDIEFFEGFLEDITIRKEAEQMKSDFVSFATHQLRTPLAGIKWMLELVNLVDVTSESASFIADARASADRLISLVNDLLAVSRLEGGRIAVRPEPVDIPTLTTRVLGELQPLIGAKRLSCSVLHAAALPPVYMDPTLAAEVVLNLLSNAVRYTPEKGAIAVETRVDGPMVEWSVRDSGIGIPFVAQGRLFEKFFRADNASLQHTEGTGLGLYIAKLVVERSGGRLTFESIEGCGSTFRFTAPIAIPATSLAPLAVEAA